MNPTDHAIAQCQNLFDIRAIRSLALDATAYIASRIPDALSDDDSDYLPSASIMLNACIAALTDDEPMPACTALADAIRNCTPFPNDDSIACTHDLALDFNHHLFPPFELCPHMN